MKIVDGYFQLPTDQEALNQGYYKEDKLPKLIISFLESFKIQSDDFSGQAGRNFRLIDWQRAFVQTGYGWRRPDGRLRFGQISCWVPRRQGKSILTAGLSLFHALKDKRAECYVIASTKEQASVIYRYAESFVAGHKLAQRIKPVPSHKVLNELKTGSFVKVLSSDKCGKSGTSSNLLLFDELHEHAKHTAREVWTRLVPSLGSKVNSLLINISTAGTEKESLAWDEYKRARELLDGNNKSLHLLPIIYEVGEFEDWKDSRNWWPALPSAGKTVDKNFYHEEYQKCKGNPIEEISFRRQYLNQWCGSPEQWLPSDLWAACGANVDESSLYGSPAILGIDYGASHDLTSWVLIVKKGELYYILPRFAIPKESAEKQEKQHGSPYKLWQSIPRNNLYFTPGNTVDGEFLLQKIKEDQAKFKITQCRYDRTRLEIIRQAIARMGIETIDVSSGANTMSPCFQFFERLVRENKLRHPNNPILNWNLENCRPKKNQQDMLMVIKAADSGKIDGIDASCFALSYFLDNKNALPVCPTGNKWVSIWNKGTK